MKLKAVLPVRKLRIGISGSRSLVGQDRKVIKAWLEGLAELGLQPDPREIIVVHGACQGPDRIVAAWAVREGYEIDAFPAEWVIYGSAAGLRRNERMANTLDKCVVVWDGRSSGTWDMIQRLQLHQIPYDIRYLTPLPGFEIPAKGRRRN